MSRRVANAFALLQILLVSMHAVALPPIGLQGAMGSLAACTPLRSDWTPQFPNLQSVWHFDGPSGSATVSDALSGNTLNTLGYSSPKDHIGSGAAMANPLAQGLATTNAIVNPTVFTYTAWFKTTSVSGGAIFDFTSSPTSPSPGAYDRLLTMNTSGQIVFTVYSSGNAPISTPASYNDGLWHHVAAVYDGSTESLYMDGSFITSYTSASTPGTFTGYFRIGSSVTSGWGGGYPPSTQFDGLIDEAGIWSTNLSAATISALASSMSEVNSSHPQWANTYGIYHFTETSGNFVDASGHGNDAYPIQSRPPLSAGLFGTAMASFSNYTSMFTTTIQYNNPQTFTLMAWFRTTSTLGGVLMEFTNSQTSDPNNYDRFLAMENDGKVMFGVNGSLTVLRSASGYNDGKWHLAVATNAPNSQVLYLDGTAVATASAASAENYFGYWRVGDGKLVGWSTNTSQTQFSGEYDEVAWWNVALSQTEVRTILNAQRCGAN